MAELEVPLVLLTSVCAPVDVLALPALLFRSACEPTRRVKAAGFVGRKRSKTDSSVVDPGGQVCERCHICLDPKMPCRDTVFRWLRQDRARQEILRNALMQQQLE